MLMPAKPAIPTLIPGVGIITEMEDIVPHVLRQVLSTPGKSSTIFDGAVYSFKNLESRYGNDPDTLAYELEKVLNSIYHKYFPNQINTSCTVYTYDTNNYDIEIRVSDNSGLNLITTSKIAIKNHQFEIYF